MQYWFFIMTFRRSLPDHPPQHRPGGEGIPCGIPPGRPRRGRPLGSREREHAGGPEGPGSTKITFKSYFPNTNIAELRGPPPVGPAILVSPPESMAGVLTVNQYCGDGSPAGGSQGTPAILVPFQGGQPRERAPGGRGPAPPRAGVPWPARRGAPRPHGSFYTTP